MSTILFAVAFSSSAQAQRPGFVAAEAEARAWLPDCPRPGDEKRQLCLVTERNFVGMYVRAMAGDPDAMGSTAFSFDEFAESVEFKRSALYFGDLGRRFDPVQACAWRMVIADLPIPPHGRTDSELAGTTCGRLGAADKERADDRALGLKKEIALHRTPTPSDDWEPKIPGLKGD